MNITSRQVWQLLMNLSLSQSVKEFLLDTYRAKIMTDPCAFFVGKFRVTHPVLMKEQTGRQTNNQTILFFKKKNL